jgi:cytochrome P450
MLLPSLNHRLSLRLPKTALCRCLSTSASARSSNVELKDIPVPTGRYPLVGHLPRLASTDNGDSVTNWRSMHAECGDIFRVYLPGKNLVVTANPSHVRDILSQQGKDVYRTSTPSWAAVFEDNKWPAGIPFARGDDWLRRRQVLGETLLNMKNAKNYVPLVIPSANNLVECLAGHLNEDRRIVDATSIRELAAMFALEAVMKVVVGVDFPSCTVPIDPRAAAFAKAVETMFAETKTCEDGPWHVAFKTKSYRNLEAAWKEMFRYPRETLQPILDYYQQHGSLPKDTDGTVLPKLIEQYEAGGLSIDEVLGISVQAIAAAVDTTGQTTENLFYNLAINPDVQDRIVEEMEASIGSPEGPLQMTIPQYEEQKYLVATLKESMRYKPTIGVHARTMTKDVNVGGYNLPEGQLVLMNFMHMTENPDIYPEPDLFLPERFLKGKGATEATTTASSGGCPFTAAKKAETIEKGNAVCKDPFGAIPFGHGGRKCVGAGFAQMDIHLMTMAILRKYKVTYDGPPLVQTEKSLLRSKENLSPYFQFEARV